MAAPPAGTPLDFDADLRPFRMLNAVRDALGLVAALGHRSVAAVVGHDFGSPVAAWCALVRPDVFRSVALMSAPFDGPPDLPFATDGRPRRATPTIHEALAALPRPRKHYQWYYSTRPANAEMWHCRQGVHDFLRAYYHHKSADWKANKPYPLAGWTAEELAKMPTYYIMDLVETWRRRSRKRCRRRRRSPPANGCPTASWRSMPVSTQRNGFQGGLQLVSPRHIRHSTGRIAAIRRPHDRRAVDLHRRQERLGHLPAAGRVRTHAGERCTRMVGCHLLDGAGHWVQQEQAEKVSALLVDFLHR